MALSVDLVWEVRTTGSDNNGGAFKAGASGTDRSQQASAQVAIDNATITTSITTNVITFTGGYTSTSADVGNVVQMLTGTNVTVGFYEITAQTSSTWTVDRNVVTSGTTTNATGNMGGCLASVNKLSTSMAASNKAWVKNGTYTVSSASVTFAPGDILPSSTVNYTHIVGYDSTRGDINPTTSNQANRPQILRSGTNGVLITATSNGLMFENLIFGSSGITITTVISGASTTSICCLNCKIDTFSGSGFSLSSSSSVLFCETTSGNGASCIGINCANASSVVANNYIHDTTGGATASKGISVGTNSPVYGNIVDTISGSVSDGIITNSGAEVLLNTVYNVGRSGIRSQTNTFPTIIKGNILEACGTYGLTSASSALPASWQYDGNAFYNNTSGTRENYDSTSGVYASGSYTNYRDKSLSGSPFTNAASADFSLNNTASAGADCRTTGPANSYPGLSSSGYRDMGPVQHQDTGGASTTVFVLVK